MPALLAFPHIEMLQALYHLHGRSIGLSPVALYLSCTGQPRNGHRSQQVVTTLDPTVLDQIQTSSL